MAYTNLTACGKNKFTFVSSKTVFRFSTHTASTGPSKTNQYQELGSCNPEDVGRAAFTGGFVGLSPFSKSLQEIKIDHAHPITTGP